MHQNALVAAHGSYVIQTRKLLKRIPKKGQNCNGQEIMSVHKLKLGYHIQCNYHINI